MVNIMAAWYIQPVATDVCKYIVNIHKSKEYSDVNAIHIRMIFVLFGYTTVGDYFKEYSSNIYIHLH